MQNFNFNYLILYITEDSQEKGPVIHEAYGNRYTVFNMLSPTTIGEAFIYAGFMKTQYGSNNVKSVARSRIPRSGSYPLQPEATAYNLNDLEEEFEIHSIMRCGNHVASQFQFIEYAKVLENFSEFDYQCTKHKFFFALNQIIFGEVWSTFGNTIKFDVVNYKNRALYLRDTQKILSLYRETTWQGNSKVVYPMSYFKRGHPLYHEHVALPAKAKPDSTGAAIYAMIDLLSEMRS
jgi:hypothetical protein